MFSNGNIDDDDIDDDDDDDNDNGYNIIVFIVCSSVDGNDW